MKIDRNTKKMLKDYVFWASKELLDNGFEDFWFEVRPIEPNLLFYILYKPDEDNTILSWQIYFQEELNDCRKLWGIEKEIYLIIESEDLWN